MAGAAGTDSASFNAVNRGKRGIVLNLKMPAAQAVFRRLALAADVIAKEPVTLQLRYLQTLTEIAVEKNSTIIFPLPVDTIKVFLDRLTAVHTGNGVMPISPPSPTEPAQQPAATIP